MVHPFAGFEVATLPGHVTGGWERDPFGFQMRRAGGLAASERRAWRSESGRAGVQLTSVHHPRLVSVDLEPFVFSQVRTLAWGQRLDVLDEREGQMQVPGAQADMLRIRVRVGGRVLPVGVPVGGRELDVLVLTWERGGTNSYFYAGAAGGSHRDDILQRFPASIRYE